MATSTWREGMAELRARTDVGEWMRGSVTVDQVYAHYQHERMDLHHPRGGGPKYLERPLFEHYRLYLYRIAHGWLEDGGKRAMADSMTDLSHGVIAQAPVEFWDLRFSGHPMVTVGERTTFDQPPSVHRLSAEELKRKSRIRYLRLPDRLKGWIWWHLQHHTYPPPRRH
jgi:hypothetical protein